MDETLEWHMTRLREETVNMDPERVPIFDGVLPWQEETERERALAQELWGLAYRPSGLWERLGWHLLCRDVRMVKAWHPDIVARIGLLNGWRYSPEGWHIGTYTSWHTAYGMQADGRWWWTDYPVMTWVPAGYAAAAQYFEGIRDAGCIRWLAEQALEAEDRMRFKVWDWGTPSVLVAYWRRGYSMATWRAHMDLLSQLPVKGLEPLTDSTYYRRLLMPVGEATWSEDAVRTELYEVYANVANLLRFV